MKTKLTKELRLNAPNLEIRADEQSDDKMIIEGYPVVFNQETYIDCGFDGWYEQIDRNAFANADISDVVLTHNHDEHKEILARTRNKSLTFKMDDHGVFMTAELIDTTINRDIYKMVKAGLLTEGSFAFTVTDDREEIKDGQVHRTITGIGKLFDLAICTRGAYGNLTEIYARSYDLLESKKNDKAEALKRCNILRLRNKNKLKLMEAKQCK